MRWAISRSTKATLQCAPGTTLTLHAWETGSEAKTGVGRWIEFYNRRRPHSDLGGKPPATVYWLRNNEPQTNQQEQKVA
ncbi:hypothetical protein ETW24_05065 [Leisingera sp. NJS204]|nr:hypothetical protein ETW24_05065 [Leisingera sp. NJS204]